MVAARWRMCAAVALAIYSSRTPPLATCSLPSPPFVTMWKSLDALRSVARKAGAVDTVGLSDAVLRRFERSPSLAAAVEMARDKFDAAAAKPETNAHLNTDEAKAVEGTQRGYLNFYDQDAVQPFVALAAKGPWIVTTTGSVVYDAGTSPSLQPCVRLLGCVTAPCVAWVSFAAARRPNRMRHASPHGAMVCARNLGLVSTGGYGMLGFGHNPDGPLAAMQAPQVMANIMTPSLEHTNFVNAIRNEIGHTRTADSPAGQAAAAFGDTCPYVHAACIVCCAAKVGARGRGLTLVHGVGVTAMRASCA